MNFDNSWDAVLRPGKATAYFDVFGDTKFEADSTSYSETNAWWLAELCRLIYRHGGDELPGDSGPTRKQVLAAVKLDEVDFFNVGDTEAALIRPIAGSAIQFAVLVLRGTDSPTDWLTNFNAIPDNWRGSGRVHKGFADALDLVWDLITASLQKNVASGCPLFMTGHSLGGALATLAASLLKPRALYTFGSPRVGDDAFGATLADVSAFRVVNNRDVVTTVPPPGPLHHVGKLHYITHDGDMLISPDDETVALDRLKRDWASLASLDWTKLFSNAPEPFADHAPVNYVAHLERQF